MSEGIRESYRDVVRQPLRDAQVVDFHENLLAVSWFRHSDGRQVLQREGVRTKTRQGNRTQPSNNLNLAQSSVCSGRSKLDPTHLRSHPADGRHVVAGVYEVPGVLRQLELTEPLKDGLGILQETQTQDQADPVRFRRFPLDRI